MKKKTRKHAERVLMDSVTSNDELLELINCDFKGLVKMTDEEITEELYSLGYETIEEFEEIYKL